MAECINMDVPREEKRENEVENKSIFHVEQYTLYRENTDQPTDQKRDL